MLQERLVPSLEAYKWCVHVQSHRKAAIEMSNHPQRPDGYFVKKKTT